jgi:hypothetical protein
MANFKGRQQWNKIFCAEDTMKYDEAIGLEMQVVDDKNNEDGKTCKTPCRQLV